MKHVWLTVGFAVLVVAATGSAENNTTTTFTGGGPVNYGADLIIGTNGINNTLLISNNTQVSSPAGIIGDQATGDQNHGTVTGSGSAWNTTASGFGSFNLYIGRSGASNTLVISDGGRVNNGGFHTVIGDVVGANHNNVTVTGSGSVWSNMSTISLGFSGGLSNQLRVTNGGKVEVINNINHNGGEILVDGTSSRLIVNNTEIVGGVNNSVTIQNGGGMFAVSTLLGGSGQRVLVTGSGSSLTNGGGSLIVGTTGANNSLVVSNGANFFGINNNTGLNIIGRDAGASNNYIVVTGAGSSFIGQFGLTIGESGSSNSLFIANGGRVEDRNGNPGFDWNVTVGMNASSTNNLLKIDGGQLVISNSTASVPTLDIRRGKLEFNSGTIDTERLLANTGPSSVVEFNGGLLITRATTVNNGSAFTVGNGSGATADLRLKGGAHTFTDGLAVAADGVLSGTGTVVGVVNNSGRLAPGFSPGLMTITGNLTQSLSATLEIEIGGTTQGVTYDFLSVSGAALIDGMLDVERWNAFLPASANTFTVLTASALSGVFTNAPISGNMYRFDSGFWTVNYTAQSVILGNYIVPEPGTLLLLATGAALVWRARGRRRRLE